MACRKEGAPPRPHRSREASEGEIEAREACAIQINGQVLRNFSGDDYLGLSQHPVVVARLQEAAAWRGVAAGISRLAGGQYREHRELEDTVAQWQGYSRGLLFGSAYLANLAVAQALLGEDELCVLDRSSPASLLDAVARSGARLATHMHASAESALRQLCLHPDVAALLVTQGVFPLDGNLAPLKLLAMLARSENATLYVDDTHGSGVIGPDGRGSVAYAGLGQHEVPLQLVALGQALGCAGAVLVGQPALIEQVAETAPAYLHSNLLPPAMAAAASAALAIARNESWRRYKLAALVTRFRRGAQQLGIELMDSSTPIQPLLIGSGAITLAAARQLVRAGFLVGTARPPTVPDGRARLRITLSAVHEEDDVDALLDALADVMRRISAE